MIIPLAITAAAVLVTLAYASVRDLQERRVPFRTWYPMLAIGIPMALWFYGSLFFAGAVPLLVFLILMAVLFSLAFYAFARLNLFGGADAWALIFLSAVLPAFPWQPAAGYPPLGFLPFTVLVNALILNLFTPIGLLVENLRRGERGPVTAMLLGFRVPAEDLPGSFGFVMEDLEEAEDGSIQRRFISFSDAVRRMLTGRGRIYTRDLRMHPEQYARELGLYRKAGSVWISYGIPFIVPLAAGLVAALFLGDILFQCMKLLMGV